MFGKEFDQLFEEMFRQKDNDLPKEKTEFSVGVSGTTLKNGGEFQLKIIDHGTFKIKVKPGTLPGSRVRLRGAGRQGQDFIIILNIRRVA